MSPFVWGMIVGALIGWAYSELIHAYVEDHEPVPLQLPERCPRNGDEVEL